MNQPLVHILIPVYNQKEFLFDSLSSVLEQTYPNVKAIVINDGSTEDLDDIFTQFSHDPRIEVHYQENQGLSCTLNNLSNISLNHADKPTFITWHSADNIYDKSAISKMVEFLTRNQDIDMVFANVTLIDDLGKAILGSQYRKDDQLTHNSAVLNLNYSFDSISQCNDNFVNACFLLRARIENVLPKYKIEDKGFEDYIHWLQLSLISKASHIQHVESLYAYRLHDQTLTHELRHDELSNRQASKVQITEQIKDLLDRGQEEITIRFDRANNRKKIIRIHDLEEFLAYSWTNEKILLSIESCSLQKINTSIEITTEENSLFDIQKVLRPYFKIPPFRAEVLSREHAIKRIFYFQGLTKNLSYLNRSRNRNTGMFSNVSDSRYVLKYFLFVPTTLTDSYIERFKHFIMSSPDSLFILFAQNKKEKENANMLYLSSEAPSHIRIVEQSENKNMLKCPLLHTLSASNAIISNSLFGRISHAEMNLELTLGCLSLKEILISNTFQEYHDLPIVRLINSSEPMAQQLRTTNYNNSSKACDSFISRMSNKKSVIEIAAHLFIDSI